MWSWFVASLAWSALISGAFLALGALAEALHALSLWRSRRALVSELSASGPLAGRIVDLRGRARAEIPLQAPLTGRSCVQFTVVMERKQPRAGQKRDDRPDLITFVGASPFVIDDGTGQKRVDLRDKRVPVTGASIEKRPLERLTAPLEQLLQARLGAPGGLWCMGRDVVATEAALLEGTEVSVVAKLGRDGALQPLHVLTGRTKVVALHGVLRAGLALGGSAALLLAFAWLR